MDTISTPPSSRGAILAIETSCDESAVAILADGKLLASEVSSQTSIHEAYGGVVPEVASRNHLRNLQPLVRSALARAQLPLSGVDAIAATRGPGLATSLMVGASLAKGLAVGLSKPFLAINHIEGHLVSPYFGRSEISPAIGLVVSGGHTLLVEIAGLGQYRLLGQTRDDAAGEAFDKVGKLLGLPYPGGPQIDRLARSGNPTRFAFPRSMLDSGDLSFSFSGLKTSVRYMLPELNADDLADVCASFQEAVVDVLVQKTLTAARLSGLRTLAISGGVSCNSRLREALRKAAAAKGLELLIADPALCTDNAAMIAYVGSLHLACGRSSALAEDIDPNLRLQFIRA